MLSTVCAQYLENYAEAEASHSCLGSVDPADAILVIPAYREQPDFIQRLQKQYFSGIQKLLIILVSNHPDNLSRRIERESLEYHHRLIGSLPSPIWSEGILSYHKSAGSDVLVVHKVGAQALNSSRSTGLARKIGADIALSLIRQGKCHNQWIFNTDADTVLPAKYFSLAVKPETAAATLYPFKHVGKQGSILEATEIYEKKISSYVEGLRLAGSPYAFHTLGSTIAVSAEHYAHVRGFPRRNAGEDFYLVNKLAKLGAIISLEDPWIKIQARCSDRVPFGTGPVVKTLSESKAPQKEKIFYCPAIYEALRTFIESANAGLTQEGFDTLPAEIRHAAEFIGLRKFLKHVGKQNLHGKQYREHFHIWFDGFRTLKFIHYLRDNYFPNISFDEIRSSN